MMQLFAFLGYFLYSVRYLLAVRICGLEIDNAYFSIFTLLYIITASSLLRHTNYLDSFQFFGLIWYLLKLRRRNPIYIQAFSAIFQAFLSFGGLGVISVVK
ncbi:hypothetical protein BJ875DRAFT_189337 [Amylocarpus encephaloides]|uniref:Uncharacterized protein n=1 Tax=Amylocarpus encephaloides TaxID=45428 RepID=A0A9P8CA03_9HELO|nr:hypothetical protein BJ875DRAFT_189337 [Amylocarpus encephaloides]